MTIDELREKRVIVRYFEDLEPDGEDPAHVHGETVSVRNIEAAVTFHPRGEIIGFEGGNMDLTTSKAKRMLSTALHEHEEGNKREAAKTAKEEAARKAKEEADAKKRNQQLSLNEDKDASVTH